MIFEITLLCVSKDKIFTLSSFSSSTQSLHTNHQENSSTNSSFLSLWPANNICELNDDFQRNFHQSRLHDTSILQCEEEEQQEKSSEFHFSHRQINYLGTRQMAESIINNNEQRQCMATGANGSNNNNGFNRRKTNNSGDVNASPKYNKSNNRAFNKDNQQQKQYREQRNAGNNPRFRQRGGGTGQQQNPRVSKDDSSIDFNGVDDDNLDDNSSEMFDFDDQCLNKRGAGGAGGSAKKTNMSHLLNFHYVDKQRTNVRGNRRSFNSNYHSNGRWSSSGNHVYRQTFSKEQFLQANCQFVVKKGSIDFSLHYADADLPIDWSNVEQVRLHSMESLKCPICLSEPQAAKITRCGHVYCWSCLLHYLALSDKSWRKCPVCSESIYKNDIRSVRGIISRCLKPGDSIHFRLMCRDRGSVLFYPRKTLPTISNKSEFEDLMDEINRQQYAHLLSADDQTVLDEVIEKEKYQLLKQLEEDGDQPEACFIKQALEENNEREKSVRERKSFDEVKLITKPKTPEEEKVILLPIKPVVAYDNAFDEKIETNSTEPIQISIPNEEQNDLSNKSPSSVVPNGTTISSNVPSSRIYFYQADDVYHGYLNGFNTRMLLHEYGSYENCPDELHFRVEAIESHFMTEDIRSQFRSLTHLPLTCEFQVIEVRLHPPIISPTTLQIFHDEIHRRRQLRTRKERLEKRRQQQAELVESQKLFSQHPPEMMYIPQQSFPVNGTDSMEEFPAIISSTTTTSSSSPPTGQLIDENLSPIVVVGPTTPNVSFAQMLKQQAPATPIWPMKSVQTTKPVMNKSISIDISTNNKKKTKTKNDSDQEVLNEDEEYYSSVPNFHSSFSLEEVFDRLKLVNGEENPMTSIEQTQGNVTTKKKNKKPKQILFATGMGGQAKL